MVAQAICLRPALVGPQPCEGAMPFLGAHSPLPWGVTCAPSDASSNGSFETSLRRGCHGLIDITIRKTFVLRSLYFLFRSFSSLLLITSPWAPPPPPPSIQDQQLGLPQHLSARGSSFRMAHLKCSPTLPSSNSGTGPWSCPPSCYPGLAWGLLLAKPRSPSR